jgi:hypothetical protein
MNMNHPFDLVIGLDRSDRKRILWICWQPLSLYKEEVYEAALRRSGSPLVALLDHIELGKSPVKNPVKKS